MTETIVTLLDRLNLEHDKTLAFFSALKNGQWDQSIYTEKVNWTPRNILAHIVSAEGQFMQLFRNIQSGGSGTPEGFIMDEFNAAEQDRLHGRSAQELMAEFKRLRADMIRWVGELTPEDLEKQGNHPVLGVISLDQMILSMTLHAHLHTRDIRRFFGGA